ncbi:MAG: hypothetical protein DSY76_00910 [Bacteroidetes bacterium]|nr:MAG: hypothetical protein DSY76_00910 [Bacteroidota bacterium]
MKRVYFFIVSLFFSAFLFQSCQPKNTYKVGYVNLQEVYKSIPVLVEADTLHQKRLLRLNLYVKNVERNIKAYKEIPNVELRSIINAYNDTINSFKQTVEREYANVVDIQKNKIQKAIDSIGHVEDFNYILSTNNTNILYAKDSSYNITIKVIKGVK